MWSRGTASFVSRWISSCPSTVCWKNHSFPTSQGLREDLMKNSRGKCCTDEGFPTITHLIELHLVLGPPDLPQFLGREHSWLEKSAQNSVSNSLMFPGLRIMSSEIGTGRPAESNSLPLLRKYPSVREVTSPRLQPVSCSWAQSSLITLRMDLQVSAEEALPPLQTWRVPGAQRYLWRLWGDELLLWHKLSRK